MNLPDTKILLLRIERGVLHLTLNRPDVRNAMSAEMVAEIAAVFAAIHDEASVRAVVLRGAGGHFCAGGDLKSMTNRAGVSPAGGGASAAGGADKPDPVMAMNRAFGTLLRSVGAAPQVVVAVCEGAVLGGGFGLVCVSDIAFAHTQAKFGLPETTRGLPPAQIAPFVVERVGLTQARRLALTGAQFRGEEACKLGLVHEVFADEAELATKLDAALDAVRHCAPQANRVTKAIVLNTARLDMDALLDDAAAQFAACVRGPEAAEGIGAFMQKREPSWAKSK